MNKWYVFFICWISWAGKGTLIKWLLNENIKNLEFVLSCKTREPRNWEIIWKDYIKLSFEEFQKWIDSQEFLEYNFVHNQDYYWTRKTDIIENWIEKWKILLKEIDILIVPTLHKAMKGYENNYSIIFLDLPIETIKERMASRWDDTWWEDYKNRVNSASKEKEFLHLVDFVIDATKPQAQVLKETKDIIMNKIEI